MSDWDCPQRNPTVSTVRGSQCDKQDSTTSVRVNDEFGIVVPEETGYIWHTKADGFAITHVGIQGKYIPIGDVKVHKSSIGEFPIDMDKIDFSELESPDDVRESLRKGVYESLEFDDYGCVDLGEKLVEERLDGVYEDDEEVRQNLLDTRDERIQSVWKEIDNELPFEYQRVAAPEGYPRTREGLRWINVTGHNFPDFVESDVDKAMYMEPWVDRLIDSASVALYYTNCD